MRKPLLITMLLALLTACKSAKKSDAAAQPASKRKVTATVLPTPGERPAVRPIDAISGRIIAVRDQLRFVVVDFATSKMPKLDQRLSVYRLDQKVAELKVSGPYLGTTVAADILAGEAREGDLVRDR